MDGQCGSTNSGASPLSLLPQAGPCCTGNACTTGAACSTGPTLKLTALKPGQVGVVCGCALDPTDGAMVRALGIRPSARLRVCRIGEPCIVEVLYGRDGCRSTCRIALARPLADRFTVGVEG